MQAARAVAIERGLTGARYARAMFATGHDAASHAVVRERAGGYADVIGIFVCGGKNDVDWATKNLSLPC